MACAPPARSLVGPAGPARDSVPLPTRIDSASIPTAAPTSMPTPAATLAVSGSFVVSGFTTLSFDAEVASLFKQALRDYVGAAAPDHSRITIRTRASESMA